MPEGTKVDGNNKFSDGLDCRKRDWLLTLGFLELL